MSYAVECTCELICAVCVHCFGDSSEGIVAEHKEGVSADKYACINNLG